MAGESAPSSPAAPPRRPSLVHRHSSQSTVSQVSQSPGDAHGHGPRPGYHKAHSHKHLVGHGRTARNPSFHRSVSKIKVNTTTHAPDDDGPPTPKAKSHKRTHSTSGATTPASPLVPPSPGLASRPTHGMKRNNTSLALPRTASQTALKKNHSSSQLSKLGSSRNAAHAHKSSRQERPDLRRAHTQPYKRHKSPVADVRTPAVHFNVGSDDEDDVQEIMEGVDDVWTEDSASASPNTTRDNTRNNTRHNSIVLDPVQNPYAQTAQSRPEEKPPDIAVHDFTPAVIADADIAPLGNQDISNTALIGNEDSSTARDEDTTPIATSAPAHSPGLLTTSTISDFTKQEDDAEAEGDDEAEDDQQPKEQDQLQPSSILKNSPRQTLSPQRSSVRTQQHTHFDLPIRQPEDQRQQHAQQRREQQEKLRQQMQDEEDESSDTASEEPPQSRMPAQQSQQQEPHQPRPQPQHHHSRPLDTDLIAKRLLEKNSPAPPRVSSISALANASTTDPKSLSQSQNGNLHPTGANNTPVVSRFVGPDGGIGSKDGTPRNQSGFLRSHSRTNSISKTSHGMRREDSNYSTNGNLSRNKSAPNFQNPDRDGIQSPTTPSGSQTPTGTGFENNSRTQQKLWLQRGLSNIEASSTPHLPGLLPTGRAQAMRTPQKGMQFEFVDREFAVVRRFHNPLLEGVERLRSLHRGVLPGRPKAPLPAPPTSSSSAATATTTTANGSVKRPETSKSLKSVKSVKSNASMATGGGSMRSQRESAGQRAKVSFHTGASPESGRQSPVDDSDEEDGNEGDEDDVTIASSGGQQRALTAGELARRIWEGGIVSV